MQAISFVHDCMDAGGRTTQESKSRSTQKMMSRMTVIENCSCIFDIFAIHGGHVVRGHDHMDVGGRVMPGAITEESEAPIIHHKTVLNLLLLLHLCAMQLLVVHR